MGANGPERAKNAHDPVEAAVRGLAGCQSGNVSRRQLLSLGLGSNAIKARLRNGSFVKRYPAVYCMAPARMDPQALIHAAVLAGGPNAVASHGSAAWLWGFLPHYEPPSEITLTQGDRRPRRITTHRCPSLQPRDITRQRDVPTTTRARTALDIAPRLPKKQLTRLINDQLRDGSLKPAALRDIVKHNPLHPGAKLLKPFVDDPRNPTDSPLEDDFLTFVKNYDLPVPQTNLWLHGRKVDVFYPEANLIVELDGWPFHNNQDAFKDDRERDTENLKYGLTTMRITRDRLEVTPSYEAERLMDIYRERSR